MDSTTRSLGIVGWSWRIAAVAIAFFAGTAVSGAVVTMLGMPFPQLPATPPPEVQLRLGLIGAALVAACVAPLAHGLRGSLVRRWVVLAAFTYVCVGVNGMIEAAVFTTYGGTATMILFFVAPCALSAGVATVLFRGPSGAPAAGPPRRQWWWRLLVVWLAFPVIYYFFGMIIYPLVRDVYEQPGSGLVVPGGSVVLRVVLLRSLLFLAVTVPVVLSWARPRRGPFLALAWAFFVLVGLYGLLQAVWWPVSMRVVHGAEILADSLVYAWVVVALLLPRTGATAPPMSGATQ